MRKLTLILSILFLFATASWAGNITVTINDHSGTLLPGAKFKVFKGPNYLGEYNSGQTVNLTDGQTYKIFAHYKSTSTDRINYTVNGDANLTFQTTLVTLHFGGGYLNYKGSGSWKSFTRPSMELFPNDFYGNTMKFQFGDVWNNTRYMYKTIDYKGKTSIEKTVAILQLLDHAGNPLAGGTAKGGYSNPTIWHVSGSTNAQGLLMDMRDGHKTNLSYEMNYNGGNQVIGPKNPSVSPYYTFSTELVTLRLQKCDNTPLDGGKARYGSGNTYTTSWWPNGNTGAIASGETSAELFQGTYSFEMMYQGTSEAKTSITIPDGGKTLTWNTSVVTLNYSGSISYGGSTGDSRWFNKPSMNLLPGTYMFHFRGAGRTNIVISGCQTAGTALFVQLKDSQNNGVGNTNHYPTFKYRFGWGSYTTIGEDKTGDGLLYFLPGNPTKTKVKVYYKGASVEKQQNVQTDPSFIFNTVPVEVELLESDNSDITTNATYKYRYGWGSYTPFDPATQPMELLPVKTKMKVFYKGASVEKQQNVGNDAIFNFQTVNVTASLNEGSGPNTLTASDWKYRHGWGSYNTLTNTGEEILPVKTKVKVYYNGASMEKQQNVKYNSHFDFNTKQVTAILKDSEGNDISSNATFKYRYGWGSYKGFSGSEYLLPVKTKMKVTYEDASLEKQQHVNAHPAFVFNTVKATASLNNSNNTGTFTADNWKYRHGWGGYKTFDNAGTEILPVKTKVKVEYKGATVEKQQNLVAHTHFDFDTKAVSATLLKSDGATDITSNASFEFRYGWGGYQTLTSNPMDLLPVKTKMKISYAGASMERQQHVVADESFDFSTTNVTLECPTCTSAPTYDYRYGWGSWYVFGTGAVPNWDASMELLPVKTKFRISGPMSDQKQKNVHGTTQTITFGGGSKAAPTSVANNESNTNLKVYPNPVVQNNQLNIVYSLNNDNRVQMAIYNSIGAKVHEFAEGTKSGGQHTVEYNTSELSPGVYYLRLTYGDQNTVKPFVIK